MNIDAVCKACKFSRSMLRKYRSAGRFPKPENGKIPTWKAGLVALFEAERRMNKEKRATTSKSK